MRKRIFLGAVVLGLAWSGFALDFSVKPSGFMLIPMGTGNENANGLKRYELGGGGALGLDVDLASVWPNPLGLGYTVGLEGGFAVASYKSPAEGTLQLFRFGGGLGLFYFPLSRLFTRIDAGAGAFWGKGDTRTKDSVSSPAALWLRFGGEAGFRFTPMFTLAAGGGWQQYQNPGEGGGALMSGLYAGLTAHITFELGERAGGNGIAASLVQDSGVFPALLSLYQQNEIGTVTLRNNENAEIRNVRVYFRAGRYSASEFQCAAVNVLAKGRSVQVPLYADFSGDILQFTDSGRILGEIVIRYSFLGKEREAVAAASVMVLERGSFPDGDFSSLAAFVSPSSPEVLEFAKNVTGIARNERKTGLNANMQYAVWLFEGLRSFGPNVRELTQGTGNGEQVTGNAPRARDMTGNADVVQFPAQTLAYKAGTTRDWGVLFAACLEASGIGSAVVPLDGDGGFVTLVNLDITEAQAATLFNGTGKLLVVNDTVWLPVSMTRLNEGFTRAWNEGAAKLAAAGEAGDTPEFMVIADAWGSYPPAPFPALGVRIAQADITALRVGAESSIAEYVAGDIQALITAVNAQIRQSPTGVLYNRLGLLQVRAGNMTGARTAFQRAVDLGYEAAKRNLENLK